MRKALQLISLLLLSVGLAYGQSLTTVTATITDPTGQAFAGGTVQAQYQRPSGQQGITPLSNGLPIVEQGPANNAALNSSGAFTVNIANLATVSPTGGSWRFIICPNATTACAIANSTGVIGTTVDLSASLSTQVNAIIVSAQPSISRAYKDAEVLQSPGVVWLDVTLNVLKYVDSLGIVRIVGSGGGGSTPGLPFNSLQYNCAGAFCGVTGTTVTGANIAMSGSLTTPQVNNGGSSLSMSSTGDVITDPFNNNISTTSGGVAIQVLGGGANNGTLALGNATGSLGASISLNDGQGNALVINSPSQGQINLSNTTENAGFINVTGNIAYVYGDRLQLGVNPGTTTINNVSPGIQISSASGIVFIGSPITLQGFGTGCISVTGGVLGTTTCGGGGGISGLTLNGITYATSPTSIATIAPPTVNGTYGCGYVVTASASVVPNCNLPGISVDASNPTSINCATNRESYILWTSGAALGLPLTTGNCAGNLAFVINNAKPSTNLVITPTTPNTISGASTLTLPPGVASFTYQDNSQNWQALPLLTLAYVPSGGWCPVSGCTYTGPVTLPASTTGLTPFTIPQGVQPASLANGAIWMTSAGMFYQAASTVVGPLGAVPTGTVNVATALLNNLPVVGVGSTSVESGYADTIGTSTIGHIASYTASNVIGNCTTLPCSNPVGIFISAGVWTNSGETTATLDTTQTVAFGDYVCVSATIASDVHDNGSTPCTGIQMGFVKTSGTSVTTATIFVQMSAAPGSGGGGLTGSGVASRVAFWSGTSSLSSWAGFTFVNGGGQDALFLGNSSTQSGMLCVFNHATTSQVCMATDPAVGVLTIPASTSTLAAGATSPIVEATNGNISCPTCLTASGGVPLNSVISPTGAISPIVLGNNPLGFTCALTSGTTCVNIAEATVSSTTGAVLDQITELTGSTATMVQLTQGSITGTTSLPAINIVTTLNNASLADQIISATVTNTNSASGANFLSLIAGSAGATSEFTVDLVGNIHTNGGLATTTTGGLFTACGSNALFCTQSLSGQLGGILLQGSMNASSNAGAKPGSAYLVAGGLSNATPSSSAVEGMVLIQTFGIKGTTVTQWGVECPSSTTQYAVTDCPLGAINVIGIASTVANPVGLILDGEAIVALDAAGTVGDKICAPIAATGTVGKAHDNGTTACVLGQGLGVIRAVAGTIKVLEGTTENTVTLSTTLVEAVLHIQ